MDFSDCLKTGMVHELLNFIILWEGRKFKKAITNMKL